jgi:hypothetical protein
MNAVMSMFGKKTAPEKVAEPLMHLPVRKIAASGAAAAASLVVVSAASAATTALRRRADRS